MLKLLLRFCFLIIFSIILTGCDTLNLPNKQTKFEMIPSATRAATLNQLKTWRSSGAFSITQHLGEPNQTAQIAHFVWDQFGSKQYEINISSALGLYQLQILKRLGSITLWKNTTIATTATTPEGLMQNAVGWSLPISNLYFWIRGIPAPGKSIATYDQFGHLKTLKQQGWDLTYTQYKTKEGIDLPQTIIMKRQDMSVKIVIQEWNQFMQHYPMSESK